MPCIGKSTDNAMAKQKRTNNDLQNTTLVFCVVLYRSFFPFSFGHNIVCPSMICMVYVAQSLVFCVVLYRSFFPFSFGHNNGKNDL
jgi:hypothetical protein